MILQISSKCWWKFVLSRFQLWFVLWMVGWICLILCVVNILGGKGGGGISCLLLSSVEMCGFGLCIWLLLNLNDCCLCSVSVSMGGIDSIFSVLSSNICCCIMNCLNVDIFDVVLFIDLCNDFVECVFIIVVLVLICCYCVCSNVVQCCCIDGSSSMVVIIIMVMKQRIRVRKIILICGVWVFMLIYLDLYLYLEV